MSGDDLRPSSFFTEEIGPGCVSLLPSQYFMMEPLIRNQIKHGIFYH